MSAPDVDTPPPYSKLPEPLTGALRELARERRILIALDFDGTLAPEVDDPAKARALPPNGRGSRLITATSSVLKSTSTTRPWIPPASG